MRATSEFQSIDKSFTRTYRKPLTMHEISSFSGGRVIYENSTIGSQQFVMPKRAKADSSLFLLITRRSSFMR
jgi:hypothetical protein